LRSFTVNVPSVGLQGISKRGIGAVSLAWKKERNFVVGKSLTLKQAKSTLI
jgi:DUF1009 family protein